jgi:prepilin-type N-terminal cleavage/methylation domain-containing protein/prepilin-type processing-associated H-X9-DG protein
MTSLAPRRAFTLIELLVVIAIIAILAAMFAVQQFAMDNDDRMVFPTAADGSPTVNQVVPNVRTSYDPDPTIGHGDFGFAVSKYLAVAAGQKTYGGNMIASLSLTCPAYSQNPQYVQRQQVGSPVDKWRFSFRLRKFAGDDKLWTYAKKITTIANASREGAMMDLDRAVPGVTAAIDTGENEYEQLPDLPVHVKSRNYAYFDGHVSSLILLKHTDSMVVYPTLQYGWIDATH